MARLGLPQVTLCAATSVNVGATLAALRRSAAQADFSDVVLFTDAAVEEPHAGIRIVRIDRLKSASDYSLFMLKGLVDHIRTSHCLIVQWDGFVLDARQWDDAFLDHDYIGAPWPQFSDGQDVGNGGFSLRSKRLLEALRDPDFIVGHPEDIAIGRTNRAMLEQRHRIRFASGPTAGRFAFERSRPNQPTFGFHGIFNMADVLGVEKFWELYCTLDDRGTAFVDYKLLMAQLGRGSNVTRRRLKLSLDLLGKRLRP